MKRLRLNQGAQGLPFHVRATAALGMWLALAEVAPKGYRVPKALERLSLQLIDEAVQLPALVQRTCRACGCIDERACPEGCYWVANDLCSSCALGVTTPAAEASLNRRVVAEVLSDRHRAKRSKAGRAPK